MQRGPVHAQRGTARGSGERHRAHRIGNAERRQPPVGNLHPVHGAMRERMQRRVRVQVSSGQSRPLRSALSRRIAMRAIVELNARGTRGFRADSRWFPRLSIDDADRRCRSPAMIASDDRGPKAAAKRTRAPRCGARRPWDGHENVRRGITAGRTAALRSTTARRRPRSSPGPARGRWRRRTRR